MSRRAVLRGVLIAAVGIALVAVLTVDSVLVFQLGGKLTRDEHTTCNIQARGLRAQPYLVGYLESLHTLTALPPDKATRRQEAQIPKKRLRLELRAVRKLNRNLEHYLRIVGNQPSGRAC